MAKGLIGVGETAPEFELADASGRRVRLSEFRGRTVVLYFYPQDDTPGCTAEACSFRDQYEAFTSAGAEVIGVSTDDRASHERFAARHRLPFVLLSDPGNRVGAQYGVRSSFGILSGRITYVIDRKGVVRMAFDSLFRAKTHVERALAMVRSLGESAGNAAERT